MIEPKATGRKQPVETGRSDPRPRRFEGGNSDFAKVKNGDKSKDYCLVYRADEQSMETYVQDGWEMELYREGGPMVGAGVTAKPNEPVMFRGHILFSIDKEKRKDLVKYGSADGSARGQVWADEVEERILDRSAGNDPLRGMAGRFMKFQNEIEPEAPDYGI